MRFINPEDLTVPTRKIVASSKVGTKTSVRMPKEPKASGPSSKALTPVKSVRKTKSPDKSLIREIVAKGAGSAVGAVIVEGLKEAWPYIQKAIEHLIAFRVESAQATTDSKQDDMLLAGLLALMSQLEVEAAQFRELSIHFGVPADALGNRVGEWMGGELMQGRVPSLEELVSVANSYGLSEKLKRELGQAKAAK